MYENIEKQNKLKILLVCETGITASLLVASMKKIASYRYINISIIPTNARGLKDNKNNEKGLESILITPQVKYLLPEIKKQYIDVPIKVISEEDIQTLNGNNILNVILDKGE